MTGRVERVFRKDWQVLMHVGSDRAIEPMLNAVEAASASASASASAKVPHKARRPVMIHGHLLQAAQVDRVRALGIVPLLFPMHTLYWGDWRRDSVFGPERVANISPTGWLVPRGETFSSHQDAPVALPDTMRVLSATVNRTTRSGQVLGPEHRVERIVAIKALTPWPAYQHFEEKTKGAIEVGKRADFSMLERRLALHAALSRTRPTPP